MKLSLTSVHKKMQAWVAMTLCCSAAAARALGAEATSGAAGDKAGTPPPGAAEGSPGRAAAYLGQREWSQAINEFSEVLRLNPHDGSAYGYRGAAYWASGEFDKAISDFSRQIELQPTNSDAFFNRASAYRAKREFTNAVSDFSRCLELCPTNPLAYKTRAAVYNTMGEFDKAISDWTAGLQLGPADANAYELRGYAYSQKGEFDKAVRDFSEAIRLDPNNDKAHDNLAWLRATCPIASLRSASEAMEAARKACELTASSNWMCIDTLAAAFAEAGNFKEAAEHERQAMAMEGPSKDELKAMQARLLLYEQRRPYRDARSRGLKK